MPYDDSNIKKMIKVQTEKKVAFSRSKKLSSQVRELIHNMLEADVTNRLTMPKIQQCAWLKPIPPAMEGQVKTQGTGSATVDSNGVAAGNGATSSKDA